MLHIVSQKNNKIKPEIFDQKTVVLGVNYYSKSSFTFHIGSPEPCKGVTLVGVEELFIHRTADAAIVKLEDYTFSENALKFLNLPKGYDEPETNEMTTTYGYGTTLISTDKSLLRSVDVPIYDYEKCVETFESVGLSVDDYMICAGFENGGKDSCQGKNS